VEYFVKIYTYARTKKANKHEGKDESNLVWEVILDVASIT
jgi:hypothetical protein